MGDFNPQERVKKMVAAIKNEVKVLDNCEGTREVREHHGQCFLAVQNREKQAHQPAEGKDLRGVQEAD
jgi:hypothetical protein